MCDEAVDGCPEALKFVPDWLVTCKKVLVMSHFVVMKWVLLVY